MFKFISTLAVLISLTAVTAPAFSQQVVCAPTDIVKEKVFSQMKNLWSQKIESNMPEKSDVGVDIMVDVYLDERGGSIHVFATPLSGVKQGYTCELASTPPFKNNVLKKYEGKPA